MNFRSYNTIATALLCLLIAACGQDPDQSNSGAAKDTSSNVNLGFDTTEAGDTDTATADTTTAAQDTTQPDTALPDTTQPDTAQPDTTQPDTSAPDTPKHDTAEPDTAQPDTAQPDTTQPDAGTPDAGTKPVVPVVRFVAMGDTGTGSEKQYKVGKVLAEHCKTHGCDFVLMLGDNFYDTGVKDENDKQFVNKFEKPYKDVKAPFYMVLGNHDYGSGGAGAEFMKKAHYIKYGKKNPKWVMPAEYWDKQVKHVHLFALDSNSMLYGDVLKFIVADQLKAMDKAITASKAMWKITFAHHPMRSNGPHGNAGCYEGAKTALIPALCGIIPLASGKGVLDAYNKLVCGRVDLHFAGHDHGRQWLDKSVSTKHCKGVELIVSGGGAKTTKVESKSKGGFEFNPVHFQDAETPGFFYAEIKGDVFTGYFVDMNGKKSKTRSFKKGN
ncbi:MAG: metallophosphoesterase [Myxococcales bacterium]|nr:metallophosphoesterase [Myxococcales bacterium]